MKILLVGTGVIGSAIAEKLQKRGAHVIVASRSSKDAPLDITSKESIKKMYKSLGELDGVVVAGGKSAFQSIEKATDEDFQMSLDSKLMGQVNLVRFGLQHVREGGSFTLTSGLLNFDPVPKGSISALVDGALEGFVMSVAIELPHKLRINCVSPAIVQESLDKYPEVFTGFRPVPVSEVADSYLKSIFGKQTGKIYKSGWS